VGESKEAALVAVICKRAAIKGGQVLALEEMRQLVRQLEACQSPAPAPRPADHAGVEPDAVGEGIWTEGMRILI
jgi:hypothetical protein